MSEYELANLGNNTKEILQQIIGKRLAEVSRVVVEYTFQGGCIVPSITVEFKCD